MPIRSTARRAEESRDRFPGSELHLLGVEAGERGEIVEDPAERGGARTGTEEDHALAGSGGQLEGGDDHGKACAKTWPFDQKGERRQHRLQWGHNNKFVRVVWEKRAE